MFEILLTLCLADAPLECRTLRTSGGEDRAVCQAEARRLTAEWPAEEIPQKWPCVPKGETTPFDLSEIAPGVYVHQGAHAEPSGDNLGDTANIGVVIGDDAVAVIDAGGGRRVGEALLSAIRNLTDKPIRWVVLTHMHPDHVLGASVLRDAGAEVVGHFKHPRAIAAREGSYLEAYERLVGAPFQGSRIELPTQLVKDRTELDLGGRRLILEAHPTMHTDNDLTVYDEATGTWFLGDLLFLDHTPALDGSLVGWLNNLEKLTSREAARVVPGHGPISVSWPEAAEPMRMYLTTLVDRTRAAIAAGVPLGEAVETIGGQLDAPWLLSDIFHRRNVTSAFKELEWE